MSIPAIKIETQAVMAHEIAQKHLGDITDKKGFAAYQCFRNFFVEILPEPEKIKPFLADESHYRITGDFQLFDQAYIDNLTLCLSIKIKSPDIYEEMLPIIDKHVRPTPQNEGFNHLYQECGGFLALILRHYEGISGRQAFYAAAQLTKYSESTIEKSYRSRMEALPEKLKNELPPPMTLTALYWTLHTKSAKADELEPFEKESDRSIAEIQKTKEAYWRFTRKVLRHYHENTFQWLQKNTVNIIPAMAKEYGVTLPLSEKEIQKADSFSVFIIVLCALLIEMMPQEVKKFDVALLQIT